MITRLTGTALQSAQLSIARYCLNLEGQSGVIDIAHVVSKINDEYRLVRPAELNDLINDIENAFYYIKNQSTDSISRAGYWKFRALSPFEAKEELEQELAALGA